MRILLKFWVMALSILVPLIAADLHKLIYYFVVIELTCPDFNVLGGGCGEITSDFVLQRVLFFAVVFALGFKIWQFRRRDKGE